MASQLAVHSIEKGWWHLQHSLSSSVSATWPGAGQPVQAESALVEFFYEMKV